MSNLIDKIDKLLIEEGDMSKWKCQPCGWVYDPKEHGGKPFSDWSGPCPECGAPKSKFKKLGD
jgi:rubredoxin